MADFKVKPFNTKSQAENARKSPFIPDSALVLPTLYGKFMIAYPASRFGGLIIKGASGKHGTADINDEFCEKFFAPEVRVELANITKS